MLGVVAACPRPPLPHGCFSAQPFRLSAEQRPYFVLSVPVRLGPCPEPRSTTTRVAARKDSKLPAHFFAAGSFALGVLSALRSPKAYCMPARKCSSRGAFQKTGAPCPSEL